MNKLSYSNISREFLCNKTN